MKSSHRCTTKRQVLNVSEISFERQWECAAIMSIMHTENIKQTRMYRNRSMSSSDVRSVYCQLLQVIMVHPRLSLLYAVEDHSQGTVDGRRRRGRPCKSWKDKVKEWTGQLISSLLRITDDRLMGSHCSNWICRSTPTTSGRHGY